MEEQSDRPNIEGTLTNIFKNMAQRVKMLLPLMQSEIEGQVFNIVHTAELNF
jgi:3-dehydroquinate dehydratase